MWSIGAWHELNVFFPDTNNGSRIVVTTRLLDLADRIGSASPLVVNLLDGDKSWDLFCEKVFAVGEGCPLELEDAGKSIVRKCKGLPLAIVVVAGYLGKSSRTQEYWVNVAHNMKSVLNSEENEQLFNILSFSYNHLPVHLKPCFVYMGTFREDEWIDVEDLIYRWIAEGFLKPREADSLEEIGKGYLKDLIDRNLILAQKGRYYCKIHDILRELCLKVAEKEVFFYMLATPEAICRERRVGIRAKVPQQNENDHPEIFHHASRSAPLVRSLVGGVGIKEWKKIDTRLRRMHTSDFGVFLEADHGHVNLRYLRYKDIGDQCGEYTYNIPSSITLFWNLQTLIIDAYLKSVIAPNEIWEMIQLRHLEVFRSSIHLPSDELEQENELVMRNLLTLWGVKNLKLSEEVCRRIPNVKELEIVYSGELVSSDYYCPHNLGRLGKLESLDLGTFNYDDYSACREFCLSLTFPSSLKKLSLWNTHLDMEEVTMMVGSLPRLETLCLYGGAVVGSEWSFVEGKFLDLKSLSIYCCRDLVNWNLDSSHFPVLENLFLSGVSGLDEFPSDIGTIPTLRSITLWECSVSFVISAVRTVVEQEEEHGNKDLSLYVELWYDDKQTLESINEKMEEEGLMPNNLKLRFL